MAGPTYTSNLARRGQFQHTDEGEKFIPIICSKTQRSGGILNRKRAYKILVRPPSSTKPNIQVKSVAAEKERAISEFKEIMRNDEPHMPLKKSIKREKMVPTRRLSNTKGKGRIKKERTTEDPLQFIEKKDFKNKEEDYLEKRNPISMDFLCFRGKKTKPKSVVLNELKTTMADHLELLSFPIHQIK